MGAAMAMKVTWFQMCLLCSVSISQSSALGKFKPNISMSAECRKIGVCDEVENYPEQDVNEIVKKIQDEGEMWQFDKSDSKYVNFHSIQETTNENDRERSLCKFKRQSLIPRAVLVDKEKDIWQFVINKDQSLQPYIVELCSENADQLCGNNVDFKLSPGYNATCKQEYSYRQTLGLDEHGQVIRITHRFPSCCMCVAHTTFDDYK